ncbi:MAG: efflux RND transporter periplasmic adaptor subunit [Burkholderiales bacterium]|jgi:multidrug efflux system membrane fusion protein
MRSLPAWLVFVLALTAATGCSREQTEPEPLRAVNVVRVSSQSSSGEIAYSGEIKPRYESALGFRIGGKIVERLVDVGDLVNSGDVLARLDPEDQKLNSKAVRSRLAAAEAAYKQAKGDLERYSDLYEQKFISRAEMDRHRTEFNVAKAELEQVRAELAVVDNQAEYTRLRADHPGVVTAVEAEVGQVVAAGQTVMTVARTADKEVAISIPENRLGELKDATDIEMTLWANPGRKYHGTVREVSPVADPVTRTYAVRIAIEGAGNEVKLGMTANVYFRGIGHGKAFELPATALFQQSDHAAVWRVNAQTGVVSAVPVKVARFYEDQVAVNGDLVDGDIVVRAGVHKLFEGEKVRVLNAVER